MKRAERYIGRKLLFHYNGGAEFGTIRAEGEGSKRKYYFESNTGKQILLRFNGKNRDRFNKDGLLERKILRGD